MLASVSAFTTPSKQSNATCPWPRSNSFIYTHGLLTVDTLPPSGLSAPTIYIRGGEGKGEEEKEGEGPAPPQKKYIFWPRTPPPVSVCVSARTAKPIKVPHAVTRVGCEELLGPDGKGHFWGHTWDWKIPDHNIFLMNADACTNTAARNINFISRLLYFYLILHEMCGQVFEKTCATTQKT